jgi:hypothetical protein
LEKWRSLRPAAPWNDSLVTLEELDEGFMRLSSPSLAEGPPPVGWAVVGTVVTPEGVVADAVVMAWAGTGVDSLARRLVAGTRFSPPRRRGMPVWAFVCSPIESRIV